MSDVTSCSLVETDRRLETAGHHHVVRVVVGTPLAVFWSSTAGQRFVICQVE